MHDFDQFEQRLAGALRSDADASVGPFEAGSIARAAIAGSQSGATRLPRTSPRRAGRFGRGRGITLLAAAALLLVGGAFAAGSGMLRLPNIVPPVPSPSVVAIATASPDVTSPSPSESAAPSASPIPVAGAGGLWMPIGSMVTPRSDHTAVRLLDGRVLVVGGESAPGDALTSAELYDPATGTWSAAGGISMPLVAATLLPDGKVLVLVGDPNGGPRRAEVYDPASGIWAATGPMDPGAEEADGGFTALQDGRVLLAGRDGAQVYDPATETWTVTGPMARDEGLDTYTVLQDGRVLVAGDDRAQLYDPVSGTWTATRKKDNHGYAAAATLLSDGKVLVAGGMTFSLPDNYDRLDLAEVYDPVTESWSTIANMHAKTRPVAAFLQPDGKVLVVGSTYLPTSSVVSAVEVYDPATGTWTALPVGPGIGYTHASLLSDGTVLLTGEMDGEADQPACAANLYDPRTLSLTTASSMLRCGGGDRSFTPLLDGTVLVAGGHDCNGDGACVGNGSAELYVPAGVPMPPLPAFPGPLPPAFPGPTARPTPLPPAAGPVPPNAQSWTVTVDNQSSEPAALFVADEAWDGLRLVGSATPNVVPAGATVKVTFLFPADGGWIYVNPRPGEGGSLVNADQIGIPGKILITADGQVGWLSP